MDVFVSPQCAKELQWCWARVRREIHRMLGDYDRLTRAGKNNKEIKLSVRPITRSCDGSVQAKRRSRNDWCCCWEEKKKTGMERCIYRAGLFCVTLCAPRVWDRERRGVKGKGQNRGRQDVFHHQPLKLYATLNEAGGDGLLAGVIGTTVYSSVCVCSASTVKMKALSII